MMGEKDGDVGTARDADILHSELDRAHPEDEHHLLLVGGRTARQRHKKRHVPQALEAVAAFIGRRFDVSKGFRYFTVNSPKGIRDHLLHSAPPWDHSDADSGPRATPKHYQEGSRFYLRNRRSGRLCGLLHQMRSTRSTTATMIPGPVVPE